MAYQMDFSLFDTNGERKYLNEVERKKFYLIANALEREDVRLFSLLMLLTGARISEIMNLKRVNIDYSSKVIVVRTLKQRKNNVYRQIPLPDFLLNDLRLYLEHCDEHTFEKNNSIWSFSTRSASRYIKSVMNKAGITGRKSSALGLRHGFAVDAAARVQVTKVQKWLGHSNLTTTCLYLDVSGKEERALAAKLWDFYK